MFPELHLALKPEVQEKQPNRAERSRHGENPHVLMVGPGPQVRGGINSKIAVYMESQLSQKYSFVWLSTYDDRGPMRKIMAALCAYLIGPVLISRADIVHVHGVFRKSFIRKLPLILIAKAMRKRVIFHIHRGTFEGSFNGPVAPVIRWMLASVDRVIVLSPICAASIRHQCPRADIVSLPNPVIVPPRDSVRPSDKKEPRILFLGMLDPKKGFTDLMRAIPAVLAIVPTASFL
jgi:glycosyltransferase involved in cell wall biosynthesis